MTAMLFVKVICRQSALYCNHKFEFTLISSRPPRAEVLNYIIDFPAFVMLPCFDVSFDVVQKSADLAEVDRIWTGYGYMAWGMAPGLHMADQT